jgi:ribosomal protein S1
MMNDSDLSETTGPAEPTSVSESAAATAPAPALDLVDTFAPPSETLPSAPAPSEPLAPESSAPPSEEGVAAEASAPPSEEAVVAEASAPPSEPRVDERRLRAQRAWERVVAARESGEVLSGIVTAAVKGGLLVDVGGVRGFLPASQVRIPQGGAMEALVKTRVPLKVIDVDQARRRIVVSHRRAAEDDRRAKRAQLIRELEVGQTREVVVVRLADFGAFVDLGGIDGLIPMGELAFERVEKASDIVKVGDRLSVQVIRVEDNGKKIALSRKNALPDPWRDHAELLRQGTVVEGKVLAKEPRLQVELAPGVVGTVRESEADPADYEIGEAIEVSVRSVDRRMRRIGLTTLHGSNAVTTTSSSGFASLGVELGRRF